MPGEYRARPKFDDEAVLFIARESIVERTLESIHPAAEEAARTVLATLPAEIRAGIAVVQAMSEEEAFASGLVMTTEEAIVTFAVGVARAQGIRLLDFPVPVYPQAGWKPSYR